MSTARPGDAVTRAIPPGFPAQVQVFEVGARDGLQNEAGFVPTEAKLELLARLASAGLRRIEATAFVSPKWVPQMADHASVMRGLPERAGVRWSALVPNLQGFEAAMQAGAREVAVFTAASESFSRRNTHCSNEEGFQRFAPVLAAAHAQGVAVRGYVSCVLGCPYEGAVAPAAVAQVARRLLDLGCHEVSLGDTIGIGTPGKIQAMLAWPTCMRPCNAAWPRLTAQSAASAAARTRAAPRATSRPRTSCTCSRAWATRQASTSRRCRLPALPSARSSGARRNRAWRARCWRSVAYSVPLSPSVNIRP